MPAARTCRSICASRRPTAIRRGLARATNQEDGVLHYIRYGKGTPLIMQHGFLGGGGYWVPQFPAFGKGFDIVAPDLPGFAGSGAEPPQDSIEGMAGAVVALADALKIERFHLIGHSMGGMVAQQIALD